ncbi:hypothetical protein SUDANB15_07402 (plasmid) [Streptomyces sp. enrichment culture]|uniref:hypothetical protein n=1 Tax=Streptomyces sp. enrichment culture TaxID=1795815 RepID=UPI003F57A891
MVRPDRGRLRSAGFVVLLTVVFVVVNSHVVYAADNNSGSEGLLAPLNITSSEGVSIDGYELNAQGGSIVAFKSQALAFALSGLFTLIRLLVGLAGWAIEVAFRFPLIKILADPAQRVSEVYDEVVVDTLGIKGLLLAWAFVFTGFLLVRGRIGRGVGEMFLTLLIAAFAASAFVRPDYLLATDGPLGQSRQVGIEVAQQSVNAYDWGGKLASSSPCATATGAAEADCYQREAAKPASSTDIARPLQDSVTNALIVKPYMLLQYGRILDPAKPADRGAYAVHLKWVTGGYKAGDVKVSDRGKDVCSKIRGPARKYCERGFEEGVASGDDIVEDLSGVSDYPSLTPGGELLNSPNALVTDEDRAFFAFLQDMKKAGDVGKASAAYAEKPTWWRLGGALLLLVAALFICGMLLSSVIVMLGTQGICVAAAAAGGVAFVAGMLPGPPRQSVWKWLSLWGIAVLALVGVCAFVPLFGIAVDAVITDGPDLMIERILLIDVLAIAGAAGHRRLLTGIASFGRRMAMRMRYAKVGGTHLPGDTSELGAALAMNSPAASGGGGLRVFTGGGRFGMLGTRQRLMGALGSLVDGAGMPVDTGRILADASAEAGRGLAPLTAAAALGGAGARLGAKSAHWLLIGRRPDREQLAKWRKPTAGGDEPHTGGTPGQGPGVPGSGGLAGPGVGPHGLGGPRDRYRDDDGQIIDAATGEVLHDQHADRTLLSTRAHNRLVRLRGYRILHRGGRAAYGATVGLPATVRQANAAASRYSRDVRQQVRVWGNTVREDGRAWSDTARQVSRALRENTNVPDSSAPSGGRRLPTASASAPGRRPNTPQQTANASSVTSSPHSSTRSSASASSAQSGATQASTPATSPNRLPDGNDTSAQGPVLPGGGSAHSSAREEARARMQELMRRTAPEAERLRQERSQQEPPEDGEQE